MSASLNLSTVKLSETLQKKNMLTLKRLLLLITVTNVAALPLKARRQSSLFNPGAMLSSMTMQTGSAAAQGGSGNPAGTPVIGGNPSQPLQSGLTSSALQSAGTQYLGSNPAGNPATAPQMTSGNHGYMQYGNPGGNPQVVASASGVQQNYMVKPSSRQYYTGAGFDSNSQSHVGSYSSSIGKPTLGKRFNPDVTNSELISNPNPVNVGLAFVAGSLMFVPGSASGSVLQTGLAASALGASSSSSSSSSAGSFNPNTLPANQNPAGNFNPANPQTAGNFNPNAGPSFIPSNTQSAGSVQSAGTFNPNAFSAGNFDPNAIPPARYDPSSAGAKLASFDPSGIGLSRFPPNTRSK